MTFNQPPVLSRSPLDLPRSSSVKRRHSRQWRAAAYIASYVVSRLVPRAAGQWIADTASRIAHAVKAGERREVRHNLSILMRRPSDSPEVLTTARKVYTNFGRSCVDLLYEIQAPSRPIPAKLQFVNLDCFEEAVKEGRGVILLGAHTGSWELGALALASRGFSITAPVQSPAGAWVSELYRRERLRFGLKPLSFGEPMIKCARTLKSGGVLGLLGDRAFGSAVDHARLFGRAVLLPQGPARLSIICGSPILSASMRHGKNGAYVMHFLSRLDPPTERTRSALAVHRRRIAVLLEKLIAEDPEQWFCFESLWNNLGETGIK